MAVNLWRAIRRLGVEPRRIQTWGTKYVLGPACRAFAHHLGVPIVAITGTSGKTTVTRLIDRVLCEAGYCVGMACTDGVTRGGERVAAGDQAGIPGLALAMRSGDVDALIAETARGGILKHGIGFRRCRVAVVTNVSEDHLGIDGVDTVDAMARVKAGIVDRIAPDGVAVLNADDPRVAAMAARVPGRAIFFSMQRPPPRLRRCVFLDRGRIVRRSGTGEADVMAARDVVLARGGLLRYNLANVMAALAALDGLRPALPVSDETVARVFASWLPSPEDRPFSFHLLELSGDHVLLSHGKNPAGYAADAEIIRALRRALGYETIVGFITHVGNRSPEFHGSLSASAASVCDRLMVVPPEGHYLRGRSRESFISGFEAGIPTQKRLPSLEASCAELIATVRGDFPGKTLYAFFNTRQHRGVMEVCRGGREIALQLPAPGAVGPP